MTSDNVNLVIRNAEVVTPSGKRSGGVAVDDGTIIQVDSDDQLPQGETEFDAEGNVLLPGAIDPHTHMGLAGYQGGFDEHFEYDFKTETRGALHAGVTTMLTFLFQSEPYLPSVERYAEIGAEQSYIDYGFHAVIQSEEHVKEIPDLAEKGITSFKLFFNMYKTAAPILNIEHADVGRLYDTLKQLQDVPNGLAMVHAENDDLSKRKRAEVEADGRTDVTAWADASPPISEAMQVEQVARLARDTQTPAYIVHVSAEESVDILDRYQSLGVPITGEVLAGHLAHHTGQDIGVFTKVSPPIRGPSHHRRLWEGISAGVIKHVGTDHAPSSLAGNIDRADIDRYGSIWDAPRVGRPGMGYLLPVLLSEGVNKNRLTLEQVAELSATNTAKRFGLYPQKGAIVPGADADLVIVDMDKSVTVDDDFYNTMEPRWSSLHGTELTGLPSHTFVRGNLAVANGDLKIQKGIGQYLNR